jgi:hypothetical protein
LAARLKVAQRSLRTIHSRAPDLFYRYKGVINERFVHCDTAPFKVTLGQFMDDAGMDDGKHSMHTWVTSRTWTSVAGEEFGKHECGGYKPENLSSYNRLLFKRSWMKVCSRTVFGRGKPLRV